jgi:predicted aconitase with swiveling domain
MILTGRSIVSGSVRGIALVSTMSISFFGGVDTETGVIVERGHDLWGQSIAGKILIFPSGKGSTVGSYTIYRLQKAGKAPIAMIMVECETIIAVGCIIAEIPCVDHIEIRHVKTGSYVHLDADQGIVTFTAPGI